MCKESKPGNGLAAAHCQDDVSAIPRKAGLQHQGVTREHKLQNSKHFPLLVLCPDCISECDTSRDGEFPWGQCLAQPQPPLWQSSIKTTKGLSVEAQSGNSETSLCYPALLWSQIQNSAARELSLSLSLNQCDARGKKKKKKITITGLNFSAPSQVEQKIQCDLIQKKEE